MWFYTGDNDAGLLARGAEFSPDATMVSQWLDLAMEEKDPAVAFLPEGITPLCEDQEVDARGLAQLPPPPPPGGNGGGQALGGGVLLGAEEAAPESSRGGGPSIHTQFPSFWCILRCPHPPRRPLEARLRGALPPPPPFRRLRSKRQRRSGRRSVLRAGGRDLYWPPGMFLDSCLPFTHFLPG